LVFHFYLSFDKRSISLGKAVIRKLVKALVYIMIWIGPIYI